MGNIYAQTKTDDFSKVIKITKRKPNTHDTDDGKEFGDNICNSFLKLNDFRRYSRYTSKQQFLPRISMEQKQKILLKQLFETGKA